MNHYEYSVHEHSFKGLGAFLTDMDAEGWELVQCDPIESEAGIGYHIVMRRERYGGSGGHWRVYSGPSNA